MTATPKPDAASDAWRPSEGDVLEGTVIDVDAGWSDYAEAFYPIVKVAREDTGETVTVHAFHEKLAQRLKLLRPAKGEKISITYTGEVPTKDGKRTVNVYAVDQPGKDTTDLIWDQIGVTPTKAGAAGTGPSDDHPF